MLTFIDVHTERQIEALAGCFEDVGCGQPADVCEGVLRLIFETYDDPAWVRLFMEFSVYAARSAGARAAITRMYERWRKRLGELLQRGIESAAAGADLDPCAAASALIVVDQGLLLQASVDRKALRLPDAAQAVGIDMYLNDAERAWSCGWPFLS